MGRSIKVKGMVSKFLVGVFSIYIGSVSASSVESADGNSSFSIASDSMDADTFVVSLPNDSFISFNRFNDFVVDEPLQIFNLPVDGAPAADVVVIYADDVHITSAIELIGPPTDLVILEGKKSGVDGKITCVDCSFVNLNRLTLGAVRNASVSYSSSMSQVGSLSAPPGSKATISNLYAPAILSVEVFSQVINLTGVIDINQSLDSQLGGVYQGNLNGDKTVGSGSVNLFVGVPEWTYEDRVVQYTPTSTKPRKTLSGSIYAPNVHILTTENLDIDTRIDTRTDLLSSIMYRGELVIVGEGIVLESLNTSVHLRVDGDIDSDGFVDLRSAGNLTVESHAKIDAEVVQVLSGEGSLGSWYNDGKISATDISVEARDIVNEGSLQASNRLDLDADNYIFNQYGGELNAGHILIKSDNGVVRNGSKTPYQSAASDTNNLINYSLNFTDGGTKLDLSETRWGAFYEDGVNVNTSSSSYVMAPSNSAAIHGNTVQIRAAAFENINPYYLHSEDGVVEVNVQTALQVKLSAELDLAIKADNYILNSSAVMEVNSPEGSMKLDSAFFNNERYRVETNLVHELENGTYNDGWGSTTTTSSETISANVSVFSVPALLISMGETQIRATEAFLNNTGYIEIFNNLEVDSPVVNHVGLLLTSLNDYSRRTFGNYYGYYNFGSSGTAVVEIGELDTLFYVQGTLIASQSDGWFHNHKPLDYFSLEAIEMKVAELASQTAPKCWWSVGGGDYGDGGEYYCTGGSSYGYHQELAVENYDYEIHNNETLDVGWAYSEITEYIGTEESWQAKGYYSEREYEGISWWDTVLEYFNAMQAFFSNVYNEVKFW